MKNNHKDNTEYQMLGKSVREFAQKELLPHLSENDAYPAGEVFEKALKKAMGLDFFHVMLPEELNGWGGKLTPLAVILKQLAEVDASLAAILLTSAVAQDLMVCSGAGEMLSEIAAAQTPGEFLIAYPLLSHPDEDDVKVTATPRNGHYQLTGPVAYVVLAPMAKQALVPAKVAPGTGYDFFLVALDQAQVKMDGPILSIGLHACPAADLLFSGAQARLVGGPGEGSRNFTKTLPRMLAAAAAVSCGLMRGSFTEALQYSRKREQGGRRILDWSELRLILADMSLKAKTADILLDRALTSADNNAAGWMEDAYTAAIYSLETACDLTSDGVQALGGYGYTKHHFEERRFRDARHLLSVFGSAIPRRLNYVQQCLNW